MYKSLKNAADDLTNSLEFAELSKNAFYPKEGKLVVRS